MKTIKIIDLLNKIANGDEVPEKIKYKNEIWEYYEDITNYIRPGKPNTLFTMYYIHKILNEEVEIIEEEKEIEKLFPVKVSGIGNNSNKFIVENRYKINELIEAVNSINKGK